MALEAGVASYALNRLQLPCPRSIAMSNATISKIRLNRSASSSVFQKEALRLKPKNSERLMRSSKSGMTVIRSGIRDARELIISKKVKVLVPTEAGEALANGADWLMLDVRPIWERRRAFVTGSLHVPLFVADEDTSIATITKKLIQFGFAGWWLGQRLTKPNKDFVKDVLEVTYSKDQPLLVVCGEGLRSLVAISELHGAGFTKLLWLAGGFNQTPKGVFKNVEGDTDLRFGAVGGVQGLLIKAGQLIAESGKKDSGSP